ncbi:hepatic triacylglycerol lipase [Thalassophryne amazonica]|uniref:hepatic triacylglycerol lipase n=1 Tax=Thalassophryne amazonica TaxID=390379 RepID=UPI001471C85C|nr:hepatic triacylglycerol lipase [Thalassophryne amazonica]
MFLVKILCCLVLTLHFNEGKKIQLKTAVHTDQRDILKLKTPYVSRSVFRMFSGGEDTCRLDSLELHTVTSCDFNSTNPLIIITHGWSINGIMESWVLRLATILKTKLTDVNVVITDWLPLANQHYPKAVQSARTVGRDIAYLLGSLKEHFQFPARKVHLIGYSLGAHISGFAGSFLESTEKIGRITGLDPAGPLFEGMAATDRLSPDDAEFVDAIHTYTHEYMGLSVGIKQAVAHWDFYPNGGDFQPGCDLGNIFDHINQYGVYGFQQTVNCPHERSVHLFIDSLLHNDKQSMAYRCSDSKTFDKGICLDCRKNRCNTLGYNINRVHTGTSKRLYLKTRPQMPYKLYHYQFRIQFVNEIEWIDPSFTIALTGTKEESGDLTITIPEKIARNKTYIFLITLEKDLGDLMLLKIHWKNDMWNWIQNMIPWGGGVTNPSLTVGKVSVKAGETQERTYFCAKTDDEQHVQVSEDKMFVRCKRKKLKTAVKKMLTDRRLYMN